MKETIRESLKNGLLFALIGAAVAVACPLLVALMIPAAVGTAAGTISTIGVLSTTLLFGGFGILNPVFQSLSGFIFGKTSPEQANQVVTSNAPSNAKQLNINVQQAPEQTL